MKKWCFFSLIFLVACVKDRTTLPHYNPVYTSPLRINEFAASTTGTSFINEFGVASDWFEIYNSSSDTVKIPASTYFCSDDQLNKSKYTLPALTIQPKGFQLIWCDSKDTVLEDVHSNFNLKSSGEFIGLYFLNGNDTTIIDEHSFGAQVVGQSEGRYRDGEDNWIQFTHPTPGTTNQK